MTIRLRGVHSSQSAYIIGALLSIALVLSSYQCPTSSTSPQPSKATENITCTRRCHSSTEPNYAFFVSRILLQDLLPLTPSDRLSAQHGQKPRRSDAYTSTPGTHSQTRAPLTTANLAAHNSAMAAGTSQPSTMQRWFAESDDHPAEARSTHAWDQLLATDHLAAEIERIVRDCKKSKKAGK